MHAFVERSLSCLDYLAVIPDRGWVDRGMGFAQRFQMLPAAERLFEQVSRERPIVLHGIGMSICSAEFFDEEYACQLIELAERYDSPWISDHLAFSRVGTGHEVNSAITLPVPYDREVLEMLAPRLRFIVERLGRPVLMENNVYYFRYPGQEFTEEEFLNELCAQARSGVLLDLHNLYTNAVNHKFSALDYLANLDMRNVIEIHIAGGVEMMGFHTDSHTGPVLESVWDLLERALPLATRLRGVTFEFHESSFRMMGESGILEQIDRAREIVAACALTEARV